MFSIYDSIQLGTTAYIENNKELTETTPAVETDESLFSLVYPFH